MGEALERAEWIGARPLELAAPLHRQRLRQYEPAESHVRKRERRGREERRAQAYVFRHEPADHRPQRETAAPRRTDEPEVLGAIAVVTDVADVRAGSGERRAEYAGKRA